MKGLRLVFNKRSTVCDLITNKSISINALCKGRYIPVYSCCAGGFDLRDVLKSPDASISFSVPSGEWLGKITFSQDSGFIVEVNDSIGMVAVKSEVTSPIHIATTNGLVKAAENAGTYCFVKEEARVYELI